MSDGDNFILGSNNDAVSETNLRVEGTTTPPTVEEGTGLSAGTTGLQVGF